MGDRGGRAPARAAAHAGAEGGEGTIVPAEWSAGADAG